MTKTPMCEDKSVLVAYLYGECTAEERQAIEAHLADCPACRHELESLQGVRGHLAEWSPPDEVLGFRVVRGDAAPAAVPRAWWRAQGWGLAAAAVLLLAVAAAIARVEIRYDQQGFVVRTGWGAGGPTAEVAGAPAAPAAVTPTAAPWNDDLRALEARLRGDLAARPASDPVRPAADGAELLRQVHALIDASEARQQRELALRVSQLVGDVGQQRRSDWLRIQQGFGRLENLTGAGVAQQRQMLDYVLRVSGRER